MIESSPNPSQVLVFAPFGKDSSLIAKVLESSGVCASAACGVDDFVERIPDNASAAIITEEALNAPMIASLGEKLSRQPAWSAFPFVILTGGGVSTLSTEIAVRSRAPLGNISLLERPLRPVTLISAVRTALEARQRQYEVRDQIEERKRVEEELRRAHDALESIVEQRTAALRSLSTRLLRVQDEERRRVARELHDGIGQYLIAIKMNLEMLAPSSKPIPPEMQEARQLIDRAISEARTLSHLLHPPLLDEAGFASAAHWYVEGFGRRSGIQATLHMPEHLDRFSAHAETALFRILQEALTNVHRHSGARAVDVTLTTDDSNATLTVRDFGKGIPKELLDRFAKSGVNGGVGLSGIRERVKQLGGTLNIRSNAGGTTLTSIIPMQAQVADSEDTQSPWREMLAQSSR